MGDEIFSGGGFRVTHKILRTKRRTYDLKNVEYVSIHQPLLVILGATAIGLFLFAISFHRYLYGWEVVAMMVASAAAVGVAALFGSMKVHSRALQDEQTPLFGDIRTLRNVKDAVEQVISDRD
jgi:hypothetical protein